tara:strand:- start:755 stop:1918 length:1164 start_codon:yes stop_codon:yes gene_type:complete
MTSPFTGSNTSHYYVAEVTPGITPTSPLWTKIRNTGGVPTIIKDALISDELDDSREITGVRVGNEQAQGEYSVELSQTSQDDLIANAMSSAWVAGLALTTIEVTVDETLKTFTRTAGDYLADGVLVGDLIRFNGLTGDNAKPFIATSVSALVVAGAAITHTLTPEVVTTDIDTGDKIGTGSLCPTMSILTWYRGRCGTVDKYVLTAGVEFTGFSFEVAVNAQVTGSFPLLGRMQTFSDTPPVGSTFAADLTTRSFAGVDGKVLVDETIEAFITSSTLTNDNEASAQFELGNKAVSFVERGRATNTVSMSGFMANTDLVQRFNDEVETSIDIILNGLDGAMSFSYPKTFLTAATPEIGGATSITQSLEGTAIGSKLQSSVIIQRLPAL